MYPVAVRYIFVEESDKIKSGVEEMILKGSDALGGRDDAGSNLANITNRTRTNQENHEGKRNTAQHENRIY